MFYSIILTFFEFIKFKPFKEFTISVKSEFSYLEQQLGCWALRSAVHQWSVHTVEW